MKPTRSILLASAALSLVTSLPAAAQMADSAAADAGSAASTGQITGVVTDASGSFVAGATVRIEGSSVVESTTAQGRFTLRGAPAGQQKITVRYFGGADVTQTITVVAGQDTEVKVTLAAATGTDGEITVTASRPIAESLAAALQVQRASTALVSVLAADAVGRFPDQNLAAAIARLPGVAVQRDQGQDRFISLRGARTSWTTVSFDGINVISPAGRETRFDTIPATIASQVAVRKAVTADL
ncbi:carboxypeptidase regulatory-like domain-containing protein, partial [Sandarakinorhabdus limnophila]|uniref:carboxypeptidase regulatory-like domain-containing protein n=1 Tax=Sandarakinorhabdus limnophila TaxID=210512 RepID=UPI0026EB21F7